MDVVGTDVQSEEGLQREEELENGGDRRAVRGVCLVNVQIACLMSCVLRLLGLG